VARRAAIEPRFERFTSLGPSGFSQIGYLEWGPERASQTVVCVHGLTRNSRDFDYLARYLAGRGIRVVALDLPGRGRSQWAANWADYGTNLYVRTVAGLIARLRVDQIDYVGTSLGGHIGMELAALPNAPVRRLVINDMGARVAAKALKRISNYLAVNSKLRLPDLEAVEGHLREILAPFGALTDQQWRHLAEHSTVADGKGQIKFNHDPSIGKHFWMPIMLDIALWQTWERVRCPTLIIRGAQSDLLSAQTVRQMQERGIAAKAGLVRAAEIADCGHAPALMAPDQLALIEAFLTEPIAAVSNQLGAGSRAQASDELDRFEVAT
jgi:pimeloyl-ACP methyl ester carboxylesterase